MDLRFYSAGQRTHMLAQAGILLWLVNLTEAMNNRSEGNMTGGANPGETGSYFSLQRLSTVTWGTSLLWQACSSRPRWQRASRAKQTRAFALRAATELSKRAMTAGTACSSSCDFQHVRVA